MAINGYQLLLIAITCHSMAIENCINDNEWPFNEWQLMASELRLMAINGNLIAINGH